jgi:CheY-like chemotaxis protein
LVAEAGYGQEAIDAVRRHDPDVLLLDLRMPRGDGLFVLEQLSRHALRTAALVLTTFDDEELALRAIRAGAKGYLLKDVTTAQLAATVRKLAAGGTVLSPHLSERARHTLAEAAPPSEAEAIREEPMTVREREILRMCWRLLEPRDRRSAAPRRGDGEESRFEHPGQDGGAGSHACGAQGGRARVPVVTCRLAHASAPSALLALGLLACSRLDHAPSPSAAASGTGGAPETGRPYATPSGPLTAERRQRVLDAMLPLIRAHYVFSDLGAVAVQAVQGHQARGDYASIAVEGDFAQRLTDDLRTVTRDIHFRVRYRPPGHAPEEMTRERRAELEVEARQGVHSVERSTDGVALLKLDSFLDPPDSPALQKAYAAAMSEVADARALVLDLRDNYGGDPRTVAFMLSYLFDSTPVHVNDIWSRDEDVTWQNWTQRNVPGRRFGGHKPIFVLVSRRTISGERRRHTTCRRRSAPSFWAKSPPAAPTLPRVLTSVTVSSSSFRARAPSTHHAHELGGHGGAAGRRGLPRGRVEGGAGYGRRRRSALTRMTAPAQILRCLATPTELEGTTGVFPWRRLGP